VIWLFLSVLAVCGSLLVALRWTIQARAGNKTSDGAAKLAEIQDRLTRLELKMGIGARHG
jgi:hypothetical protein